ncbi:Sodium/hydrogen exchanger family-domain-containing protein [Crepidotus variabilis]|uniref:Sodium/hydrogen exchanger family-domain-containing protein n=1 Tax=Crepidotus variabilis TaxID=179855 RepID=A0A9P6E5C5_9AGAR|nr:Sodium/hydrogen exchanger family-domain-containing protein [Crepidotus variabilis]
MTQLLGLGLSRIRQPRVIAEVIGGIIVGPTVMGRIPNFKNTIFPDASMPLLDVTSTVGLLFFLFLVGLELDTRVIKRNLFVSVTVSASGLILPLGLGAALGVSIYREFINPNVNFGYFILFTAVAMGITAFPVLCRILTELQLLDTDVGLGWVLLALTVALVNASSGLTALWVLLASVGYTLFFLFPVRWAYRWLAGRTRSLEHGAPTPFMMTVTLLIVLISAFFTDIIGVHAIFGGFLAGLIVPHDNEFAISIVEKIEDLVSILFLSIYFTLSGLRTNLGLLNHGKDWGYIIVICLVAFTSKLCACGTAALVNSFKWREAGAIGSLMSCKGLVELIVLNIGLQAQILDAHTFSMFVVHALVLTFMTTILVLAFYPLQYRAHRLSQKATLGSVASLSCENRNGEGRKHKFVFVLDKIESLSAAMTVSHLLKFPAASLPTGLKYEKEEEFDTFRPNIGCPQVETLTYNDSILTAFRTFGRLNVLDVKAKVSVVNPNEFPEAVANHAAENHTDLTTMHGRDQTHSVVSSELMRNIFSKVFNDVALFIERGHSPPSTATNNQHLFLPFFGGPDDRLALSFLVQLCENPAVTATVVRIFKSDLAQTQAGMAISPAVHATIAGVNTVYGSPTTETRLASDTADVLLWDKFTTSKSGEALNRITFRTETSSTPLTLSIDLARKEAATGLSLIIIAGRKGEVLSVGTGTISNSVAKTIGDVGAALVGANVNASLLVLQTAPSNT